VSRTGFGTTLAATFKASPGKTGVFGLLVVALLVIVGRQLWSSGPRPAEGAALPGFVPIDNALVPEVAPAAERKPRPSLPDLPDKPARDLFDIDWSLFARVPWVDLGAEKDEDEDEDGIPSQEASVLTLELTLTAPAEDGQPYAVINGTTVRVGDRIDGFVVESISPGLVLLFADGRERIALRMD